MKHYIQINGRVDINKIKIVSSLVRKFYVLSILARLNKDDFWVPVIKMLTIMSHPDESTPDPIKDFLTTGRVGRRNALPDILSEHAHVSTADLPEKMDQLTTGGWYHWCRSKIVPATRPRIHWITTIFFQMTTKTKKSETDKTRRSRQRLRKVEKRTVADSI